MGNFSFTINLVFNYAVFLVFRSKMSFLSNSKNIFITGKVLGYTIIVTEDYTKNTEGDAFLPGWRDVQKFSVWPPYQVSSMV